MWFRPPPFSNDVEGDPHKDFVKVRDRWRLRAFLLARLPLLDTHHHMPRHESCPLPDAKARAGEHGWRYRQANPLSDVDGCASLDHKTVEWDDLARGAEHEVAVIERRRGHDLERDYVNWPLVIVIRCIEAPNMRKVRS